MKPLSINLITFLLSIFLTCVHAATQVSLISYTFTNNVLAGSIKVQNIAYSKTVTVVYAIGSSWVSTQTVAAVYSSGPGSDGYETWTFSGTATGATQFYIRYVVSGTSYYDPGNNVNYQIAATTSTKTSSTSAPCTVTQTITMTSAR